MEIGVLASLFATFLTSKRKRHPWFKVYVVYVNTLSLVQTALRIILVFDAVDRGLPRVTLLLASPVLTIIISASVQAFYMHRCWLIFKRRVLPIVPFLLCLLIALVSGSFGIYYLQPGISKPPFYPNKITMTIWGFSSFALDCGMTFTTIIFLYRSRKGSSGHSSVFSTIWQVMWASAAPPLILMMIVIIAGCIFPQSGLMVALMSADMTGKFFVLSLMITIAGQGYVRRQLEQAYRQRTSDPSESQINASATSTPVFAPSTSRYEMEPRRSTVGTEAPNIITGSPEENTTSSHVGGACFSRESHVSITKPYEPFETHYEVHSVQLPL